MGISQAERNRRTIVEGGFYNIVEGGEIQYTSDKREIFEGAIKEFAKMLSAKIKNLQIDEGLQITYSVDIINIDGKVRGGSGSERNMPEYIEWRKRVFERDSYKCVECGSNVSICAHHVKQWANHPDQRFEIDNGITLCANCHSAKHPHLKLMEPRNDRNTHK